jgi:hypothetical protein
VASRSLVFAVVAASFLVVQALSLAGRGPAADVSIFSVFALFGVASLGAQFVLQAREARARWTVVAAIAAIGAVVAGAWAGGALEFRDAARLGLAGAGALGLAGYLREVVAAAGADRRARLLDLRDALIVPLAVMQVPFFLWTTTRLNPVYDAHLLAFERALGLNVSALAHAAFSASPMIGWPSLACYYALPVGLAAIVLLQPTHALRTRVLLAVLATGVLGFALYAVSPVVGILQAYPGGIPIAIDAGGPFDVLAAVPRNGMPSLHTAWAIVIALNVWRLPAARRAALVVFAAANLWTATAGIGHWVMDIIAAVPMAAGAQIALVGGADGRLRPLAGAALSAGTVAWVVAFRTGVPFAASPGLAWTAVALTAIAPLALAIGIARRRS